MAQQYESRFLAVEAGCKLPIARVLSIASDRTEGRWGAKRNGDHPLDAGAVPIFYGMRCHQKRSLSNSTSKSQDESLNELRDRIQAFRLALGGGGVYSNDGLLALLFHWATAGQRFGTVSKL
jgi:hypothetical protein